MNVFCAAPINIQRFSLLIIKMNEILKKLSKEKINLFHGNSVKIIFDRIFNLMHFRVNY